MIFKVAKFFIKLIFGIALGISLGVYLVAGTVVAIRNANEDPHKKMSFVIRDYEVCAGHPQGTGLACPICGKNFYKQDIPCCSQKCEHKYQEMKTAWDNAQAAEKELNKLGKRYK